MIHNYFALEMLESQSPLSERALAKKLGISRLTLRKMKQGLKGLTFESISKVSEYFEVEVDLLFRGKAPGNTNDSTVAVSMKVIQDGNESWQTHFFNLMDEFRRSKDVALLILEPSSNLDPKLRALLAAIVCELCDDCHIVPPRWTQRVPYLKEPWFPSRSENLKAMALLESPLNFRKYNIYVLENFSSRV
jgi:hypothetical protein